MTFELEINPKPVQM